MQTATANETWWVGHPSEEYLAGDDDPTLREVYTDLGHEPPTRASVIRVKGPQHLAERAIVPLRFGGDGDHAV